MEKKCLDYSETFPCNKHARFTLVFVMILNDDIDVFVLDQKQLS